MYQSNPTLTNARQFLFGWMLNINSKDVKFILCILGLIAAMITIPFVLSFILPLIYAAVVGSIVVITKFIVGITVIAVTHFIGLL